MYDAAILLPDGPGTITFFVKSTMGPSVFTGEKGPIKVGPPLFKRATTSLIILLIIALQGLSWRGCSGSLPLYYIQPFPETESKIQCYKKRRKSSERNFLKVIQSCNLIWKHKMPCGFSLRLLYSEVRAKHHIFFKNAKKMLKISKIESGYISSDVK